MAISEQGSTEHRLLEEVFDLLRTKDLTFLISRPFAIPGTDYGLFGKSLEAFFKLSLGSIANMVIFLKAAHSGVQVRERSGETIPIAEKLIGLITQQVELTEQITKASKTNQHIPPDQKYVHVQKASNLLTLLKSLPR